MKRAARNASPEEAWPYTSRGSTVGKRETQMFKLETITKRKQPCQRPEKKPRRDEVAQKVQSNG